MKRLALLAAVGATWLFLAALPALADGGPHVKTINDGSLGINADSCAGCHRAHTASGPFIINAADEEAMCLTCHSAGATGASTDVMTGVQYTVAGGTTQLGALRGGGFDEARINSGSVARLSYLRNAVDVSQRPKVPVRTTPAPVTSAHLAMPENGLDNPGVAWGNGGAGTGAGPAVELSCASCHNPHGNGQFRILNKIPESTGADFDDAWVVDVLSSTAATDRITTVISHALQVGDVVTIAGTGTAADGANRTVATVSSNYFTLTGVDILADTTGGTVSRTSGVTVTDATLPTAGDARNYTVMQTKGTEGTESTYLLYRSQVEAAAIAGTFNGIAGAYGPFGGDYFARNVPWNPQINNPACVPTVYPAPAECATANSAPNGRPSTFSGQITAWCSSCHTRYFANNNPVDDPPTATTGAAWANPRPGDDLYKYQHRTVPGRDCLTCHVSHGSNAAMTGTYSGAFDYPDGTASDSSRLLKIDNRGTCQACHDPTGTIAAGTYIGPANPRVP